jgi:UDP-glucuronate 4-epimerase
MEYQFTKPILVTGGAGFIGSHLIDHLLEAGNLVTTIDDFNDFYDPKIKAINQERHFNYESFKSINADIRDQATLRQIFGENDIGRVVHLAAMAGVRPSLERPAHYTDVNITGTQSLLEVSAEHKIDGFIFASSSSVYGNNEKTPFSEDDNVDRQISPYGATKKMGEILCYTYNHLYDIPMTCLRFFTVYGSRQRPEMAIHKFVRHILSGKPIPFFGDGETARDYTYIDDIISGILSAMKNVGDYAIYNLGNSEPIKLKELVAIIEEQTGKNLVLDKQELPPGDVIQTFADITRAKKHLEYNPQVHINDGIGRFIDWYEQILEQNPELY